MKQTEVFKKIGGIIKELNDQYEYLETLNGELNDLELELFVSNAHFLTDHIEILSKLNLQNNRERQFTEPSGSNFREKFFEPVVQQMHLNEPEPEEPPPAEKPRPVEMEITNNVPEEVAEVPQMDLTSGSREDTYAVMQEPPETIRHELVLSEAENWEDDEHLIDESAISKNTRSIKQELTEIITPEPEQIPEPEPVKVEEPPVKVINDEQPAEIPGPPVIEAEEPAPIPEPPVTPAQEPAKEEKVLTFNQKMADKSTAKKEQQNIKPIGDIKLAITLNDKMLYVKDLFNGYNLAYSEAVEILNRFNTFDEAMRFLKTNYIIKNNWDAKPATTEKFYALLRRRYA